MKTPPSGSTGPSIGNAPTTPHSSGIVERLFAQLLTMLRPKLPDLVNDCLRTSPAARKGLADALTPEFLNFLSESERSFAARQANFFDQLDQRLSQSHRSQRRATWRKSRLYLTLCRRRVHFIVDLALLPLRFALPFCGILLAAMALGKVTLEIRARWQMAELARLEATISALEKTNREQAHLLKAAAPRLEIFNRLKLQLDPYGGILAKVPSNQYPQPRAVNGQPAGSWIVLETTNR